MLFRSIFSLVTGPTLQTRFVTIYKNAAAAEPPTFPPPGSVARSGVDRVLGETCRWRDFIPNATVRYHACFTADGIEIKTSIIGDRAPVHTRLQAISLRRGPVAFEEVLPPVEAMPSEIK